MLTLALLALLAAVPPGLEDAEEVVYKQTPTRPLSLYIFAPSHHTARPSPAILFFFGGGWTNGSVLQFAPQARHFAAEGYLVALVDYRVKTRDQTTPFESVMDAKSAMRWMRANASQRNVNPNQIAAAGGSAGGHIAGATALLPDINDPQDNLNISPTPNALVLYNPVVDTTASGFGAKQIGQRADELSLTGHIAANAPPTIIFHGTADHTVPFANVVEFRRSMQNSRNRCVLVPFEGEDHGFFNNPLFRPKNSAKIYNGILDRTTKFLGAQFSKNIN